MSISVKIKAFDSTVNHVCWEVKEKIQGEGERRQGGEGKRGGRERG